ncbi:MAG TPA: hypothetical protein VNY29_14250 [Terriglobales bacterium]|jgi:hypothetical protein|nr:hypothetical protein [Terriglobales bacterium]
MKKWIGVFGTLLLTGAMWAQTTATVPEGTALRVRLETTISTFSSKVGDPFQGKISEAVVVDRKTVIPAGAMVEGRVTKLNEPRRIKGKPTIVLFPENVVMPDGQRHMLNAVLVDTDIKGTDVNQEGQFKGAGHDRRDQIEVGGGTGAGMLVGGLIGGGPGLLIGGAIGASATTTHWLVQRRSAVLPSGTQLVLELSRPMTMSTTTAGAGQ